MIIKLLSNSHIVTLLFIKFHCLYPIEVIFVIFTSNVYFLSYLLILDEELINTAFWFDSLTPIVTPASNFSLQYQP